MEQELYYRVHKISPLVTTMSHISQSIKIHFNIIVSSITGSPKWSLPFRFTYQNYVRILIL